MVGPKGLERVVNSLRVIAPELPFDIRFVELEEPEQKLQIAGYHITAFRVKHNVTCYGYTIEIPRGGRFDVEAAKALGLPVQTWNRLQKGETITLEGRCYTPDMVMGPARKGIKVTYCTDSRPVAAISQHAKAADLFICEGMYAEPDKLEKARQYKHMTFYEAAHLAKDAGAQELWLTHFSPSMVGAKGYMKEVRKIFPNAFLGEDGKVAELDFQEG
jgi:ribonuclease Z